MSKPLISRKVHYSSVLGTNIKIRGDLEFSGGLYIDGQVTGDISIEAGADGLLTLDENARIEGDVKAPEVLLNGEVVGNVYAERHCELLPKAKISGNLYYRSMQLALGAQVNGQLIHANQKTIPDPEGER